MRKSNRLFNYLSLVIIGMLFLSAVPAFANGKSPLQSARERLEERLASLPGFAGIAHSEEEGTIIVFLENEQAKGNVPESHEGFPVQKKVTGRFTALGFQVAEAIATDEISQVSRLEPVSPLVGGISVSAYIEDSSGTPGGKPPKKGGRSAINFAGTLGMVTYDNKILSNAHVLALDPNNNKFLPLGTPVIQPGSLDGGTLDNSKVGALEKYITLNFNSFNKPNYADAAIATLEVSGSRGEQFDEAGNYTVSGTTTVAVGDTIRKSGRTTGVTTNTVSSTNASVRVFYGNKWAYYKDQILVNQPFLEAGDSGSVVDKDGQFVGLVFAGSSTVGVINKASYIISGLGISAQ